MSLMTIIICGAIGIAAAALDFICALYLGPGWAFNVGLAFGFIGAFIANMRSRIDRRGY